jgi:AraC family transcriptional regulator
MRIGNNTTERGANSQQVMSSSRADTLDAPLLYLSSNRAGWEGLGAEAFLEPTRLEGWKGPAAPDIKLILFAGGPLQLDTRYEDDPRARLVVREGDFVLRPAVEPYEVGWQSLSSAPTRTLHLHLNRNLLLRTAEELDGCDPARVFLPRRAGFRDAMLREIAFTLWRELEQSTPAGKLYAQAAAQILAVHLLRHYTSAPIKTKEVSQLLTHRQVRRVTDFVLADLGRDLTLEAMAEQVGFSPYHFARLFRQTTGESPHQFVLRQRIEKAQYLLRETKIPLASVALESGFANQSHLTRIFKRYLGLTPKAYRQES